MPLAERLVVLFRQVTEVIARFAPDAAAVEETFVNKNAASTLKLGVARGVVLLAPAERGLPVTEYSTNLVKKSVVGSGHAERGQIQLMVRRLLPGCAIDSADAADALAVAIWPSATHHRRHPPGVDAAGEGARMIAKLSGVLDQIGPDGAVIDVGGVGYLVFLACASHPRPAGRRRRAARRASRLRPMSARTTSTSTALSTPPSATGSGC